MEATLTLSKERTSALESARLALIIRANSIAQRSAQTHGDLVLRRRLGYESIELRRDARTIETMLGR